jgi:GDPmannose 4,6-dehydratase
MKTALVIGSAGQDGRYLSGQLAEQGYAVVGVDRATLTGAPAGLTQIDLLDLAQVDALLAAVKPAACFYLAAVHHSSEEAHETNLVELFHQSFALHVDGWLHVLEGARRQAPACRLFYAASSHVFGAPAQPVQDESTPLDPTNVYGISKAAGVDVSRYYRARGLHVSNGFLYNHESPLRPKKFVSQRVAFGAVEARRAQQRGERFSLELGSTSAAVDWGYAPDYTDAMIRIVSRDEPDDFIVATGQPHTIAELCEAAFGPLGLDWREIVVERAGRVTKQLGTLTGDASKLRRLTNWKPSISFEEMIHTLVAAAEASGS